MRTRPDRQSGGGCGGPVLVAPAHRSTHLAIEVGVTSCSLHEPSVTGTRSIPMGFSDHFRVAEPPGSAAGWTLATTAAG
jgi:hypothetical protein